MKVPPALGSFHILHESLDLGCTAESRTWSSRTSCTVWCVLLCVYGAVTTGGREGGMAAGMSHKFSNNDNQCLAMHAQQGIRTELVTSFQINRTGHASSSALFPSIEATHNENADTTTSQRMR